MTNFWSRSSESKNRLTQQQELCGLH